MTEDSDEPSAVLLTHPVDQPLLITAPAGSGKTESLAIRARGLIEQGAMAGPRRLLAVTYSNKAKDNLRARLARVVGPRSARAVDVRTLHSLCGRVTLAHGSVLGLDLGRNLPQTAQHRRLRADAGINYRNAAVVDEVLSNVKRNPANSDEDVLQLLEDSACREALEYEHQLRAAQRMDFDDLLRYGSQLLAVESVAALYRNHYCAVMVDEVQDLSSQQLQLVLGIAEGRATFAGDEAQGIYGFAGAEPVAVFSTVRSMASNELALTSSYRSSPAVLAAVNALARHAGAPELACHDPGAWSDDCTLSLQVYETEPDEAPALASAIEQILDSSPEMSIGVMARMARRLSWISSELSRREIPFEDWSAPTHVPRIAALLKRHAGQATFGQGGVEDHAAALLALCIAELAVDDVETRDELQLAVQELVDAAPALGGLRQAVEQCRTPISPDTPVGPGVHLLTGHAGKGQEFDRVFIVGLEEGKIPSFFAKSDREIEEERKVLHVMLSRARRSLVLTRVRNETRTADWIAPAKESRWWGVLAAVPPHSA